MNQIDRMHNWPEISTIGPQLLTESTLARRTRFHQSWYRYHVLKKEEFGTTTGQNPRLLGSILTNADADLATNFTSPDSVEAFWDRRKSGWGIDPVRCTKFLTSSQALTLNLFGPLINNPNRTLAIFSTILQRDDLQEILKFHVEYSPPTSSEHLGDRTLADALVVFRTTEGNHHTTIEVKYADRFNSRTLELASNYHYLNLCDRMNTWKSPYETLRSKPLNQMIRCHALSASSSLHDLSSDRKSSLILIHHHDDTSALEVSREYENTLSEPEYFKTISISSFIELMNQEFKSWGQGSVVNSLHLRYSAQDHSQDSWLQFANCIGIKES